MPPEGTEADDGEMETLVGAGTVIATEADFVESATDVAVSVTINVTTGGIGAVYVAGLLLTVAVGEIDPQVAPLQVMLQVTPLPDESLLTVAVKGALALGCTVAIVCDRETLMGDGGTFAAPPPQPQMVTVITAAIKIPKSETRFLVFITTLTPLSANIEQAVARM